MTVETGQETSPVPEAGARARQAEPAPDPAATAAEPDGSLGVCGRERSLVVRIRERYTAVQPQPSPTPPLLHAELTTLGFTGSRCGGRASPPGTSTVNTSTGDDLARPGRCGTFRRGNVRTKGAACDSDTMANPANLPAKVLVVEDDRELGPLLLRLFSGAAYAPDLIWRTVTGPDGSAVSLSDLASDLLRLLADSPARAFTRDEILARVFPTPQRSPWSTPTCPGVALVGRISAGVRTLSAPACAAASAALAARSATPSSRGSEVTRSRR
jgi:hypothetical protein